MKVSLRIIQDEHRSVSAVLHALKHLVRIAADATLVPDFRAFRAMIRYMDEYPERLHHPKEEKYLFAPLVAACPAARALVERLKSDHRDGARLVRELERAVLLYEDAGPDGWAEFSQVLDEFSHFEWSHMRLEEKELLPLVEKHFSESDWRAADEGFASNTDLLAQVMERDFQTLFTRLVNLTPAPVGLGDPWKRASS